MVVCMAAVAAIGTPQVPVEALVLSGQLLHAAGAALLAAHICRIACSTLRLAQCPDA